MAQRDGGPAFPVEVQVIEGEAIVNNHFAGMSLLDWFAGQALAIVATFPVIRDGNETPKDSNIAQWAYDIADALIAEREKRQ